MHRIPLTRVVARLRVRSYSSPRDRPLEVDDLCLPVSSPYSLESLLPPRRSSSSFTPETVSKLHRLAALVPPAPSDPSTSHHLAGLDDLVAIVQRVQDVDTSSLEPLLEPGQQKQRLFVDARIRAQDVEPIQLFARPPPPTPARTPIPTETTTINSHGDLIAGDRVDDKDVDGETLLSRAEKTEGKFFVAKMPEHVRTRKVTSAAPPPSTLERLDEENRLP